MKFKQEAVCEELTTNLTSKGEPLRMSEKTMTEFVSNLVPLIGSDEMELPDFITKVQPLFESANANIRNDVSVSVKKYQEDAKKKPTTPVTPSTKAPTIADEEDNPLTKQINFLTSKIEALETKSKEKEKETKTESNQKLLAKDLREKGITDKDDLEDMLSLVTVTETTDIKKTSLKIVKAFNKLKGISDSTPVGKGKKGKQVNYKAQFDYLKNKNKKS